MDYTLCTINDSRRERLRNSLVNRFNIMGRLKHVKISKFETVGEKFINNEVTFNHRRTSLKTLIKKIKCGGHYEDVGLPLPINKFSRPVGVIRDDMRDKRPYKIKNREYEKDSVVFEYMNINENEMLTEFTDKDTRIFSGDWRYARRNIVNMCTDNERRMYSYFELINGYFSRADIDLVLPKLGKYNSDSIIGLPINPKAKSGHLTSRMVSPKRNISTEYTKEAAKYYAEEIMNDNDYTFDKSLTSIGGREKRVNVGDVDKQFKTRGINNPEDIPTLISQSVIKQVNENLQKRNEGFNYGGRINGGRNYLKFLETMACDLDEINVNPDITQHDGSVQEVHAVTAIALIRCCFDPCEKLDKLFIYILSSVIFRRFVVPESGIIYEVTKGLSTGHGFTSLMTTLVAYGTLSTALHKVCSKEDLLDTRILNAGDDMTAKFKTKYVNRLYQEIKENSGFDFDDIREHCGYFAAKGTNGLNCTFLKKKYNNFSWNDKELFANLLTPTMKTKGFGSKIGNLKQMILQAPFDRDLNNKLKTIMVMHTFNDYAERYKRRTLVNRRVNHLYNNFLTYLAKTPGCIYDPLIYLRRLKRETGNFDIWCQQYQDYTKFNVINYLIFELEELNVDINTKQRWFNKHLRLECHRVTMRLAVFDIGKKNTNPRGFYYKNIKDYRVMRI